MDGEKRFRVFNRCKYDIGVNLVNGKSLNIKAGNFQLLSVNDILFIDGVCTNSKFFSSKQLVPVDDTGKELTLEDIGGYHDDTVVVHMNDDEIMAELKKPAKAMEAWLKDIEAPEELHAIYLIAKEMDLPTSKLKILNAKLPNKDWLEE